MMFNNRQAIYVTLFLFISWPITGMADPSKSELTSANNNTGCDLIPYTNKKQTCKSSQAGIHINTSCNGSPQTCNTATNCVEARTGVQDIFASTITSLNKEKKNIWKGNNKTNKDKRTLANSIINKIEAEQPAHSDEVKKAKTLQSRLCI